MFAVAFCYDLRIPGVRSLKEKRSIMRRVIESVSSHFRVGVAEVGQNDLHQRCELGIAVVSGSSFQIEKVMHQIDKYLESVPEIEVLGRRRFEMEEA